jgi:AraC family transcriptional activator of mtrCDE
MSRFLGGEFASTTSPDSSKCSSSSWIASTRQPQPDRGTAVVMLHKGADHTTIAMRAAAVAASLATSLMMLVLRAHFERGNESQGILALLARRQTARALLSMLAELARDWTLDELAELANTSRATLVRPFRAAVQMAPLAFLSELRLTFARHRILVKSTPLALIAEGVGYQSETAFSRAYHRRFGVAPGADRKACGRADDAQHDISVGQPRHN